METVALVDLTNNWSMVNAFVVLDSFQTNSKSAPDAVTLLELSWSAELVLSAQVILLTMDKNAAVQLDSSKLE